MTQKNRHSGGTRPSNHEELAAAGEGPRDGGLWKANFTWNQELLVMKTNNQDPVRDELLTGLAPVVKETVWAIIHVMQDVPHCNVW